MLRGAALRSIRAAAPPCGTQMKQAVKLKPEHFTLAQANSKQSEK